MDVNNGYWLTRLLLQRGLAFIYLIAFLVVMNQFRPLCGEKGLLPVSRFVSMVSFRDAPSIFLFFPKDEAFTFFDWFGVALAFVAITGLSERFGTVVSMAVWLLLWILYLSFVNIGQTFYGFGWESILLESGFLAVFLGAANTEPKAIMIWLFRWVLFRVILGAGLIKLRGDPCWRDLTCLDFHFETQPMPNPLSWYFHWLPGWAHKTGVLFNHFVEVVAPFFYFAPQPLAAIAGALTVLFQGNDAPTLALFMNNPFPNTPPRYVRALYYRYRFTTPEERSKTGCWWQRELVGEYFPPVSKINQAFRDMLGKLGE